MSAGVFYVVAIILVGGAFPNKALTDPIYSLFSMEVVKERERGTTNGIMHAFSEFPMGVGAWIAGPFMAGGHWVVPYYLARAVYALTFLGFYAYFVRFEAVRAVPADRSRRERGLFTVAEGGDEGAVGYSSAGSTVTWKDSR